MICDFMYFSAVFQSYQDDGWMIMKYCVHWNLRVRLRRIRLQLGSNSGLLVWISRPALDPLSYRVWNTVISSVLQIRRGNRDNFGMIIHIYHKNIFCDSSLELSRRESSNASHNICFCWEIRKIVFELSSIPPLIWSSDSMNICM